MINILTNEIEIAVAIAVDGKDCKVSGLSSRELPWLEETGAPFEIQPRTIIEEELLPALNSRAIREEDLLAAMRRISEQLASHFESALEITATCRLRLLFEELESGSLDRLQKRHRVKDPQALMKMVAPLGSIEWKSSAKISIESARHADFGQAIQLVNPSYEASPGAPITLALKSSHNHPLLLEEIRLLHREERLLSCATDKELPPSKEIRIQLPALPVRRFGAVFSADGLLDVELHFRGARAPHRLASALAVTGVELERPALSLFFDMGSVQFKQMLVGLGCPPEHTDLEPMAWTNATSVLLSCSTRNAESFAIPDPKLSNDVIDSIGLPGFSKEQIDCFDDKQLAVHFARAIQLVARDYHARQRRLIGDFYWAFPNLGKRDFQKINAEVNLLAASAVLGRIVIMEESECLRQQFAEPLATLGEAARNAVKTRAVAKEQHKALKEKLEASTRIWEAYETKNWLFKGMLWITGQRPDRPDLSLLEDHKIPTLEEWHEMFSAIECDLTLSDYLVLDAGGYTLDVYGSISAGTSKRRELSRSFAAGSNEITRRVKEQLAKKRGCKPDEIDHAEAERIKLSNCDPQRSSSGEWSALCREATISTYKKPLDHVIEWVVESAPGRGIPVILSGGGSRNRHLRELISSRLQERNLGTVPLDSGLIFRTLLDSERTLSSRQQLFCNVVSAFQLEDEFPRYSALTDVIGGLSARALALTAGDLGH